MGKAGVQRSSGEGWGAGGQWRRLGCREAVGKAGVQGGRAVVQRASSEHTEFTQVRGGQEENPGGILHVPSFTEGL